MNNITKPIDLRRFFRAAKRFWWLYLVTFLIMTGAASFYAYYRFPSFDTTATMLIEDSSDTSPGGLSSLLGRSFSIGGFGSSSVGNEIFVIDSHDVLVNASRNLKLNRMYIGHNGIIREFLYPDSPVELIADDQYFDTLSLGYNINIKIKPDGAADIEFVRGRFFPKKLYTASVKSLPYVCDNPEFPVLISPTASLERGKDYDITINVNNNEAMAAMIVKEVFTETPDKLADAIQLSYSGPNKEFNKMLLNGLLNEYNKKRVSRRKETARNEVEFLDARLAEQLALLTTSEKQIEEYKTENNISDIVEEVKLLVGQSVESEKELLSLRSSRDYYRQVLTSLRSKDSDNQLIPVSEELSSPLIESYNTLMLQRKQLALSATPDNTALKILDSNLKDLRASIEKNAEGTIAQSTILINSIIDNNKATEGRLKSMPAMERKFFELTRDNQLQNELYLFLTEKRENAMLKYQSDATLGFVVEQAYCALKPSKKKTYIAFFAAFLLTIILPTCLVIFLMMRKDSVESLIDLNFDGIESHSAVIEGKSVDDMRFIRRIITEHAEDACIYCLNLTSDKDLPSVLAESMRRIQIPVEVFNSGKSNDDIMSRSFISEIDSLSESMRLIVIPQIDRIKDVLGRIKSTGAYLLIFVGSCQITRRYIKSIVEEGLDPNSIFVVIAK